MTDPKACKYRDPLCPCQDGAQCHHEGKNPMVPPQQGEPGGDEQRPEEVALDE